MVSTLIERVEQAVKTDSRIICDRKFIHMHPGVSLEHMQNLGLEKRDLKRLEKWGMAVRGYTQSNSGRRVRWILIDNTVQDVNPAVEEPSIGSTLP